MTFAWSGEPPHPRGHDRSDIVSDLWHADGMKAMRQILSDRMLATVLAVVFAYLLAFQGFTGNMARASTAVAAQDPFHVMCGASGLFDAGPSGTDRPLKKSVDCPCATLCRLASSAAPAILASAVVLLPSSTMTSSDIVFPGLPTPAPARRDILPDARGPPSIS
jgi:hypothetical protein